MLLKPPFFKQERIYSCVPACLKMVLAGFGHEITEADLCHLSDTTINGTDAFLAVDALRRPGFAGSASTR
ncbi:MAG: cysteine peptidase family C39 domain-containing protein [Blastocatellia bacterium]